jgi:hypothetical protein
MTLGIIVSMLLHFYTIFSEWLTTFSNYNNILKNTCKARNHAYFVFTHSYVFLCKTLIKTFTYILKPSTPPSIGIVLKFNLQRGFQTKT